MVVKATGVYLQLTTSTTTSIYNMKLQQAFSNSDCFTNCFNDIVGAIIFEKNAAKQKCSGSPNHQETVTTRDTKFGIVTKQSQQV